ncbi:hypothetical protein ACC807_33535 [Rhizobium ruizarguesonis]|nr:hypothetical protein E0H40_35605 [Rhizobium leguminosarum bv. viciae]
MMSATLPMGKKFFRYDQRSTPSTWSTATSKTMRSLAAATYYPVPTAASSVIVGSFSNAYSHLADLIQSFEDPAAEMHVDREAVRDARLLMGRLISANICPPKAFPSGGDAVVFVWEKAGAKDYVYYADDVLSLTHMPSNGDDRQFDIDLREAAALTTFATYIGR